MNAISYCLESLGKIVETFVKNVDYAQFFTIIFVALSLISAISVALRLLADKKSAFSFLTATLILLGGSVAGATAFAEHRLFSAVFKDIISVVTFGAGEICASSTVYALFLLFAASGKSCKTAVEDAAKNYLTESVATYEERKVYPMTTVKLGSSPDDYVVDYEKVYDFLDGLKENGRSDEEIELLKSKIGFYDGLEITSGTIRAINRLFSQAVRLARDDAPRSPIAK